MILSFYILIRREKLITFETPPFEVFWGCWKSILAIAIPSGLARLVVPIATGIITLLLAGYGDYAVAAYGVGSRIEFLASSILFALAASIGPFVGQNFGQGNVDRVVKAVQVSSKFAIGWGVAVWILLVVFARPIAGIFNDNPEVIETVRLFLIIVPAGFGLQGILSIVNSNLNTIGKSIQAFFIIVIQMLVFGLPAIYLGMYLADIEGIFIALALTYIFGGAVSLVVNKRIMKNLARPS